MFSQFYILSTDMSEEKELKSEKANIKILDADNKDLKNEILEIDSKPKDGNVIILKYTPRVADILKQLHVQNVVIMFRETSVYAKEIQENKDFKDLIIIEENMGMTDLLEPVINKVIYDNDTEHASNEIADAIKFAITDYEKRYGEKLKIMPNQNIVLAFNNVSVILSLDTNGDMKYSVAPYPYAVDRDVNISIFNE